MTELEKIRSEHDCGCEVCSTVSKVCPASASSYAEEILRLRAKVDCAERLLSEAADAIDGMTREIMDHWQSETVCDAERALLARLRAALAGEGEA